MIAQRDNPHSLEFPGVSSDTVLAVYLWRLACLARPGLNRRNLGRRIEYLLRLMPYAPWVGRLRRLFHDQELHGLLEAYPALMDRSRRPFLDRRWTPGRRIAVMQSHYRWLAASFSTCRMARIYSPEGLTLAALPTAGGDYTLGLVYDRLFDKEGDLMLTLNNPDGCRMGILSFSVHDKVMLIGGIQGGPDANPDRIRAATKDCEGLRPLALLTAAAQLLAQRWGLRDARGVADRAHVYRHWRYRYREIHRIHRSYDTLWTELGGQERDGWFHLGIVPAQRNAEDIPARKRALYKRRYALLDNLRAQLKNLETRVG